MVNDLKSVRLLDKAGEEGVCHSAVVFSLEDVSHGLQTPFVDQAVVPSKHAFASQVLPPSVPHHS